MSSRENGSASRTITCGDDVCNSIRISVMMLLQQNQQSLYITFPGESIPVASDLLSKLSKGGQPV